MYRTRGGEGDDKTERAMYRAREKNQTADGQGESNDSPEIPSLW